MTSENKDIPFLPFMGGGKSSSALVNPSSDIAALGQNLNASPIGPGPYNKANSVIDGVSTKPGSLLDLSFGPNSESIYTVDPSKVTITPIGLPAGGFQKVLVVEGDQVREFYRAVPPERK
jgi:hypothetical protein